MLEKVCIKSQSLEVKRDIFNPESTSKKTINNKGNQQPVIYNDKPQKINIPQKKEKKIDDSLIIKSRVTYEGYILKKDKLMALLNLDGDFVYAFKGDSPAKDLNVFNITTKEIIFNYKKIRVKIPLKGEE